MPRTKKPTNAQIEEAAELRAKGSSWEAVAQEMGLLASTLRLWPTMYADRWAPSFHRAETDMFIEAVAEAIRALRKQLRSNKPLDVRDAAKQLLGFQVQLRKKTPNEATPGALFTEIDLQEFAHEHRNTQKAVDQIEADDRSGAA
jgi:hypothetical protein